MKRRIVCVPGVVLGVLLIAGLPRIVGAAGNEGSPSKAAAAADVAAPDTAALTALLEEFLAGASRDDVAAHDRFWGEDLVYTGSAGRRIGKADIMGELRSAPAKKPDDPTALYGAEEIRIQQFGDAAVIAFRLVGTTTQAGRTTVSNYLNTGTFIKRDGAWKAVAWQATRMPRAEETAKKELLASDAALQQALAKSDAAALRPLLDESFVWTRRNGEQTPRQPLLDMAAAGRLKYAPPESAAPAVSLFGESAIVRGVSKGRSLYEATFVVRDGAWKVAALQTIKP